MNMTDFKVSAKACDTRACGFKCQAVCPTGVFLAAPRKKLADYGIEPEYLISPRFTYFCNGCMECVTICPEHAITIKGHKTT